MTAPDPSPVDGAEDRTGSTLADGQRHPYLVRLDDAGLQPEVVGTKAASLSRLAGMEGVDVPGGFCVTTDAFRDVLAGTAGVAELLTELSRLRPDDRGSIRELTTHVRAAIEAATLPDDLVRAVAESSRRLRGRSGYAVRSSATAEDLPTASFAGQHDTYLNVVGTPALLRSITGCWASLYTERAVMYRLRQGLDHGAVAMGVIVQETIDPSVSGVLFTADPVGGDRTISVVQATFGLGEALVSGAVDADTYRVQGGSILERSLATKTVALRADPEGGTREEPVDIATQVEAALTDGQVLDLVSLGGRIESAFGSPQDIEWCTDECGVRVVQSRPITTLFPVPETDREGDRIYVSVGHQQMMTDPMTPLGASIWQMTSPAPMTTAGARLYVDVTEPLSSEATRGGLLDALGRSDPLIRDALETALARYGLRPATGDVVAAPPGGTPPEPDATDPAIVTELVERHRAAASELDREIRTRSGTALLDFISADIDELRSLLFDPQSHQALTAGFEARWWLDDRLEEWLGERSAADVLALAAPGNVTTEMGLALLDVADTIRSHPAVVDHLRRLEDDEFLDELVSIEGGRRARDAIVAYLDTYGMRCVGEIDIARPRWSERPSALVPLLLSHVEHLAPGERQRRLERDRQRAERAERDLLERLRTLPEGAERARQTERMVHQLRAFAGYREYPKYALVQRYFAYKRALLGEARRLVEAGTLQVVDDLFLLTFDELREVVRTDRVASDLIVRRRAELRAAGQLSPPRVLTSAGEVLDGAYRRDDVPADALVGLGVSAGSVEGRARVVLRLHESDLEPGDILVTPHTDPSWSLLFPTVAGLVTEVGGATTHGAVVAREFGLPTVVGVARASQRIRDGQRIRVDGTNGYVQLLPSGTEDEPGLAPPPT